MDVPVGTAAPGCPGEQSSPRFSLVQLRTRQWRGFPPPDSRGRLSLRKSVQKALPVERIPLRRTESRIAYDAPQFFFSGAVGYTGGADDVFLQHYRAHVVAAEAQAHLADFQTLRHPIGLHVQNIRKIEPRNRQQLQILNRRSFIPVASAERGIGGLETPRDERGDSARPLLQIVNNLQMVDAVLDGFPDAKHHSRGGSNAKLVRGAMHLQPIGGQAFQPSDFVANFVVEDLSAAAGNRIESRVAQPRNRVAHAEVAVLGDRKNLRSGVAVQMNLRETLLDAAQHALVPVDLEIGMQAALHSPSHSVLFHRSEEHTSELQSL